MKHYHTVLTVAGSDSGGGAGIQADIKSISACGCYAASAITAVTVQNTLGVEDVFGVPENILGAQMDAVLRDIGADAVKVGMLHCSPIVEVVREMVLRYEVRNLVVDPVMVSTSGHRLIEESAIVTLEKRLLPLAKIITPNIPEAEILLGHPIGSESELPQCARELSRKYSVSVFLKAGHLKEERLVDYFCNRGTGECLPLESVRIRTRNTHGTGCTLSSALAAFLARGFSENEAAVRAKEYINDAIAAGAEYEIGHGFGPVNHFLL